MGGGKEYHDFVRVVRRTAHQGSGYPFTLGGEFAWGHPPGTVSVRAEVPSIVTLP